MRIIQILRGLKKNESGEWVVDFMDTPVISYSETLRERTETIRRIAQSKGWSNLEVEEALDSGSSVYVTGKFLSMEYRYID